MKFEYKIFYFDFKIGLETLRLLSGFDDVKSIRWGVNWHNSGFFIPSRHCRPGISCDTPYS